MGVGSAGFDADGFLVELCREHLAHLFAAHVLTGVTIAAGSSPIARQNGRVLELDRVAAAQSGDREVPESFVTALGADVWRFWAHLTPGTRRTADAATIVGCPVGTIRSRVARGRAAMAEQLRIGGDVADGR